MSSRVPVGAKKIKKEYKDISFADIFFNFHITYVNVKGEVVFDRKSIAFKYLKGKQGVWQTSVL